MGDFAPRQLLFQVANAGRRDLQAVYDVEPFQLLVLRQQHQFIVGNQCATQGQRLKLLQWLQFVKACAGHLRVGKAQDLLLGQVRDFLQAGIRDLSVAEVEFLELS